MVRVAVEVNEAWLPRDGVVGLGTFVAADAEALRELDRDGEHRRRFELPADQEASVEHSLSVIAEWARARAAGERFAFALRLCAGAAMHGVAGGELVGGVELWPRTQRTVNVSYWIHPPHRRQGYARRGVLLASAWARQQSPFRRLEILVDADNLGSHRVALGAGFAPNGVRGGRSLYQLELEGPRPGVNPASSSGLASALRSRPRPRSS